MVNDMDSELTRQLIRLRLGDGVYHMTLGSGQAAGKCAPGCGAAITAHQTITLRLDAEDWSEIRLHDECFQIWDDERLKDAQPGHGSTPGTKKRVA